MYIVNAKTKQTLPKSLFYLVIGSKKAKLNNILGTIFLDFDTEVK